MKGTPPHLKALEEIESNGVPGLVEVLREEGVDAVRYILWDATGWPATILLPPGVTELQRSRSGRAGRSGAHPRQTITEVVGPTWQQLMDRWNERYPEGHGWPAPRVEDGAKLFPAHRPAPFWEHYVRRVDVLARPAVLVGDHRGTVLG